MQQKIDWTGWGAAVASELPGLQVKIARNDIHTFSKTIDNRFTFSQMLGIINERIIRCAKMDFLAYVSSSEALLLCQQKQLKDCDPQ